MAKKKVDKVTGCRLCKYRVSIPLNQNEPRGERKPACCFHLEIDDKKKKNCDFFTETDFYIKHPEEP